MCLVQRGISADTYACLVCLTNGGVITISYSQSSKDRVDGPLLEMTGNSILYMYVLMYINFFELKKRK